MLSYTMIRFLCLVPFLCLKDLKGCIVDASDKETASDNSSFLRTAVAAESSSPGLGPPRDLAAKADKVLNKPCVLYLRVTDWKDRPDTYDWDCELDPEDGGEMLPIEGISLPKNAKDSKGKPLVSGFSTLSAPGLAKANGKVSVPLYSNVDLYTDEEALRRRLQTPQTCTGSKTVLVIRTVCTDIATGFSLDELSDSIFGTFGDEVNLKSQYAACSNDQVQFNPAEGEQISNGVRNLNLSRKCRNANDERIRQLMDEELTVIYGNMRQAFSHTMYCMPEGIGGGGWIGYGWVNHWRTVYNNDWCTYTSIQMHEIGHNCRLAHAGEDTFEYGDRTGFMGNSYKVDDDRMCFNAANEYQLDWFRTETAEIDMGSGELPASSYTVTALGTPPGSGEYMIVRLANIPPSSGNDVAQDIYISFNHWSGVNADTREGRNKVLVVTRDALSVGIYRTTLLLAKLALGDSFQIPNTENTITITSISPANGWASFTVSGPVSGPPPPTEAPMPQPTPPPTLTPPTAPPTIPVPTMPPTIPPTPEPVSCELITLKEVCEPTPGCFYQNGNPSVRGCKTANP